MKARSWILGVAAVLGGWYLVRDERAPRATDAPQLAVAGRGFTLHDPGAHAARVLDLDGQTRREVRLRDAPREARVLGASGNLNLLWRERDRIHVARIADDGARGKVTSFGKRAVGLCDGVASNADRFSVGWLEADGTVWFVFGPTAARRDVEALEALETTGALAVPTAARPTTTWCTLAVAGNKTVLLWRRDQTLYTTTCGKQCPGMPPRVRGEVARRPVLGFGCAGNGCALATRDGQGALHLTWMKTSGATTWDRALPRDRGAAVEVIGAGDRQLAVAFEDADGHPVVLRATTSGDVTPLWRGDAGSAPSLAWVDGVLAIAHRRGGQVVTTTIPLPR